MRVSGRSTASRILYREDGVAGFIVAITMVVLLGMVALSMDFGLMLVKRRGMVNANDAAALAAAISCARNDGQLAADAQADALATSNVNNAVRATAPQYDPPGSCSQPSGKVTVHYQGSQKLYFAPIVGVSSPKNISFTSTARWGPAGGAGGVLPLMVNEGRLSTCQIPGTLKGTQCWFYVDNNALGNATWALMNVQPSCSDGKYGWNVSVSICPSKVGSGPTYKCPTFSNAELQAIVNQGSPALSFNYPQPTYVCTVPGNHASVFDNMSSLQGSVRLFPVNNEAKQIKSGGQLCPYPTCTPDMFDIEGFIQMKILNVWKGSDSGWDSTNCPGVKKGSAYCLHTVWLGYTTDPGIICDNCKDFGVRAVKLSG